MKIKNKIVSLKLLGQAAFLASSILTGQSASAHTTYGGTVRDLSPASGSINGSSLNSPYFKSINTQTVMSNFGWAAGTDPAFGNAHHIKAFRFTLAEASLASISVSVNKSLGIGTGNFLPAFSLYSGLFHTNGIADYDTAAVSLAYLATLGGIQPRHGAFDALKTWKMGNDAGELSMLTYIDNAADGDSMNFGSSIGIHGDGLADGSVQASFWLAAGDYSLVIGGADISSVDTASYGLNTSLTVIPELATSWLIGLSGFGLMLYRRRPSVSLESSMVINPRKQFELAAFSMDR